MKLSFIILNYNTRHHLRVCIQNIQTLSLAFPYEIIVVDNASRDGSVEMMQQLFPDIPLILNEKNVGHPAGNNVGIRAATGEYLAIVNPDIIFRDAEDVNRIIATMDAQKEVAFLGPKLHNPDGTVQSSCYRKYSKWTPAYRRTFIGKLPFAQRDIANHLMLDFNHNETREVNWLLGACLFVRATAIAQIGLMNERLFLYFGDYEWCDRAWQNGWKVIYYHDVHHIYHYHRRESAPATFSLFQVFSYVTRIHIKDWIVYRTIISSYAKSH